MLLGIFMLIFKSLDALQVVFLTRKVVLLGFTNIEALSAHMEVDMDKALRQLFADPVTGVDASRTFDTDAAAFASDKPALVGQFASLQVELKKYLALGKASAAVKVDGFKKMKETSVAKLPVPERKQQRQAAAEQKKTKHAAQAKLSTARQPWLAASLKALNGVARPREAFDDIVHGLEGSAGVWAS